MMPFTCLWFPDPVQEATFARDYAARHFAQRDVLFLAIRAFASPLFACVRLWQLGLSAAGLAALLIGAGATCLDWVGRGWLLQGGRARTAMAVITHVTIIISHALDSSLLGVVVRSPASLAHFMLLQSFVLAAPIASVGMPLMTKHLLAVYVAAAVLIGTFASPRACDAALSEPQGGEFMLSTWHFVNSVFSGGALERDCLPVARDACWSLSSLLFVACAIFLPSYVTWAVEYAGRTRFDPQLEKLNGEMIRIHLVLFIPIIGCVWMLLTFRICVW